MKTKVFSRRDFMFGSGVLLAGVLAGTARKAWPEPLTADSALIDDLVAANRILAALEIVDGYGHVSVRHLRCPQTGQVHCAECPPPIFIFSGTVFMANPAASGTWRMCIAPCSVMSGTRDGVRSLNN